MNESQLNAYGICTPVSIGIESNRSLVLLEKRLAVLIKVVMYECEFLGGGKGLNGGGGGNCRCFESDVRLITRFLDDSGGSPLTSQTSFIFDEDFLFVRLKENENNFITFHKNFHHSN